MMNKKQKLKLLDNMSNDDTAYLRTLLKDFDYYTKKINCYVDIYKEERKCKNKNTIIYWDDFWGDLNSVCLFHFNSKGIGKDEDICIITLQDIFYLKAKYNL